MWIRWTYFSVFEHKQESYYEFFSRYSVFKPLFNTSDRIKLHSLVIHIRKMGFLLSSVSEYWQSLISSRCLTWELKLPGSWASSRNPESLLISVELHGHRLHLLICAELQHSCHSKELFPLNKAIVIVVRSRQCEWQWNNNCLHIEPSSPIIFLKWESKIQHNTKYNKTTVEGKYTFLESKGMSWAQKDWRQEEQWLPKMHE